MTLVLFLQAPYEWHILTLLGKEKLKNTKVLTMSSVSEPMKIYLPTTALEGVIQTQENYALVLGLLKILRDTDDMKHQNQENTKEMTELKQKI